MPPARRAAAGLLLLLAATGVLRGAASAAGYERLHEAALAANREVQGQALVAFGVAKALNVVASVAETAEVSLGLGVGGSVTVGRLVEPLDDLVERFADVLLLVLATAAATGIVLQAGHVLGPDLLLAAALALWGVASLAPLLPGGAGPAAASAAARAAGLGRRFGALALLAGLGLPVFLLATQALSAAFVEPAVAPVRQELAVLGRNVDGVARAAPAGEADDGWLEAAARVRDFARQAYATVVAIDFDALLRQVILLSAVFLLQTIVFPLLLLALAWGLFRRLGRAPPPG